MTRSRFGWSILVFGLVVPALAGCEKAGADSREGGKQGSEAAPAARRVIVVKPVREAIARSVTQPANVLAYNEATLYAQVAGYLQDIAVDKGDLVEKDQVLATIAVPEIDAQRKQSLAARAQADAETIQAKVELERAESSRVAADANLKRAQADLSLQEALYKRTKGLLEDKVVSEQDLEIAEGHWKEAEASLTLAGARLAEAEGTKREAQAHIEVARAKAQTVAAELEEIDARLAYSKIRAPFKGIITARFVDPGAMIQQATSSSNASKIVTVDEVDVVRVDFEMPESEVAGVASGQRVTLRLDAYPGRNFEGVVRRDAGALDPSTRTMLVEAEYHNKDGKLRPGMFGEATLELERHENALVLPAEAVRNHDGKKAVFVAEGGIVHRRVVQVGIDSGAHVEVTGGIGPNDSVVLGGGRLTDGAPVIAMERKAETVSSSEKSE